MNINLSTSKHKIGIDSNLINYLNDFTFEFYSKACQTDKNVTVSPLGVYVLLNLIRSCSAESICRKLTIILGEKTNETVAKLVPSLDMKLVTREDYLRKSYFKALNKTEKELKIFQSSTKLSERLKELGELENLLALILESTLNLDLEWKMPFKSMSQKGVFVGPSNRSFEINLMKIPNHK